MQHRNLVLEAELRCSLEEVDVGQRPGGIVRVVDPEHAGLLSHVGGYRVEVGQEAVLFGQRQVIRRAAREHRADRIDRVSGIGHERHIAGVDEAECGVGDAFLCADQRHNLGRRVERDLEALCHPACDALAQIRQTLGFGVAVVGGHIGVLVQRLKDVRMRGQVGVADPEGDDLNALLALLGDLARDFDEEIRREIADALSGANGH